jgi:hypothetical protein
MSIFNLFTSKKYSEKDLKEAFRRGRRCGYEDGLRDGMAKNFERTTELTKAENDEVIQFLISRGLELCCYDVMRGGFRIRKRQYRKVV